MTHMPDQEGPHVHIEEIERGPRPIAGVPTSTAAILGEAERGTSTPRLVTSYQEYQRWFGDVFDDTKYVPNAVRAFFENGGTRAVISRLVGAGAATAEAAFGDIVIRAAGPGSWGSRVFARISDSTRTNADGSAAGFRLQLACWSGAVPAIDPFTGDGRRLDQQPTVIEDFDNLVTDSSSPDYYGARLPIIDGETSSEDRRDRIQGADRSALVVLVRGADVPATTRPANGATLLIGGADDPMPLGVDDYRGVPSGSRTTVQGLAALEQDAYRDVSLIYAPAVDTDIARAIVAHCERMRFRFAVIDSPKATNGPLTLDPRAAIADSSYGAFYHPWLMTADPRIGAPALVPPGGSVLGIYARVDMERGVFKAPANESLRGARGVEFDISKPVQDVLNPRGVNVIRVFPDRGIVVWGARTMTADALWRYVNVRRLFIFLERSIEEGTQWVVFEPNDERLWARVADTVRLFLRAQWRAGALLGRTEDEAFFITCDRSTMTQDDILNGRLICEIGLAPVRPAEFVIFRISQRTVEAQQ